jgi:hypothetical protein
VHDFAAGRDHHLEARQRIALAEFLEQRDADPGVGGRGQRQGQRRQRAGLDLTDVRERLAFFVQGRFGKAQQPNTRLGGLWRIAPAQQRSAQAVLQVRDGLAHGGLRKIKPLRGAAEPTGFDDGVEAAQLIAFDRHRSRITDPASGYPLR